MGVCVFEWAYVYEWHMGVGVHNRKITFDVNQKYEGGAMVLTSITRYCMYMYM